MKLLLLSLSDQHSVERIVVMARERARSTAVARRDRQLYERVSLETCRQLVLVDVDTPQIPLDGNLPERRGTGSTDPYS